ncbi:MAG TPA: hypothetical protein VGR35_02400 [Tepidisphaeraceae bacterium]|nr:hypothetical protein [Tepidisphaeraceae bacterium]
MAEEMRPASPKDAPDPSNNYERSHPEREAGMGRLDNNKATPQDQPDGETQAVHNKQQPDRQINAQETSGRPAPEQPDHSMKDEEPTGWDQAPTDIHDNRQKRHPRKDGRGGTP